VFPAENARCTPDVATKRQNRINTTQLAKVLGSPIRSVGCIKSQDHSDKTIERAANIYRVQGAPAATASQISWPTNLREASGLLDAV